MAITYPLSMPLNVGGPAHITLSAENKVAQSYSPFTFSEQTYVYPGQRWLASVTLPPMKRDRAEPWITFLMSLKGRRGFFLLNDPNAISPQGSVSGVVSVSGGSQSGSTLLVDGLVPNLSNVFRAGDYIQLGSGASSRLHKILTDASANSSGMVSLEIWPDLRESPPDNTPLIYQSASGLFRLAGNTTAWSINQVSSYGITFDCVEYVW